MQYDLIKATDEHMTRKQLGFPRPIHYYPSEASVVYINNLGEKQVSGTCLRQIYFKLKGSPRADTTPYTEWIFALGKAVEQILVEQYKQMGIWVDNNVKFYWQEYNISGEVDCIIRDPIDNCMIPLEIKSFYGYQATKDLCGNAKKIGRPKTSQMLQLCVYLKYLKDIFPYGKMIYYARDSAKRAEFNIELKEESQNKTSVYVNGVKDNRFYVENILNRYVELNQYITLDTMPPADYTIQYSDEKIEKLYELEEIGEATYKNWKKGKEKIGDWQCNYCPFSGICWGE
jgi:CRISPR/Cas system-associated exonuclease Cas4 (RecB family)